MKTNSVNPLKLDKETIAKLDAKQLQEVIGGKTVIETMDCTSSGCNTGGSSCKVS